MPELTPEQIEIKNLQRKVEAQARTINVLMDSLEERQAGTDATQFQVWSQNVQLEEVLKRKTESLQASEAFLNAVIDTAPAKICILDGKGAVMKVNQVWKQNLLEGESCPEIGVVLEDLYRSQIRALNRPEGLPDGIASVVNRQVSSYSEQTLFAPHHYMTDIIAITGTAHTLVIHANITAFVAAQTALEDERKQNELLSLVAKHTTNGILIINHDGAIEWRNRTYENLLGFELDGMTAFDLLHRIVDDQEQIRQIGAHLLNQTEFQADVRIKAVDGQDHYMNLELRTTPAVNGSEKFILIAKEITDSVRAKNTLTQERRIFENVISNVPHGVYWKDRDGRYLGCNDAYAAQLDLPNREALIGKTDSEFDFPASKLQSQNEHESTVLNTGIPALDIEEQCMMRDQVAYMLTSRVPLRDDNNDVTGVLGIFADITSVKSMEAQLNQVRRLEAIGQLSAGIAHEINTPMQYIGDNIQFLERATTLFIQLGEEVEKLAKNDEDEGLRNTMSNWLRVGRFDQLRQRVPDAITSAKEGVVVVSQIVQAMKAFAHPGGVDLKLADINAGISNTIMVSRNEWKYVAEIHTELAETCMVKCNIGELNQVFLNIIVNSAHAIADSLDADKRMGLITISTHDEPDYIEVRISDDGKGMPEHVRSRVFEQFFTTKPVGSGTGLGLPLAHTIVVDHHGGAILVDSTPGEGTTFRVRIPKTSEETEVL